MKVEVRLFATLAAYLPDGTRGDSVTLAVPDRTTVGEIIRSLGIPPHVSAITVINGHDAGPEEALTEGDELAMFPPLAGG